MKSEEWKTYRTRFLVKAKKLSYSLSFLDHLGRRHCGRKGDYLVESSEGVLSIAPQAIFEDIYVPMFLLGEPGSEQTIIGETTSSEPASGESVFRETRCSEANAPDIHVEFLEIEELKIARRRVDDPVRSRRGMTRDNDAAANRRKSPQPCRDRRTSSNRIVLM